jgi:hypothetical protein
MVSSVGCGDFAQREDVYTFKARYVVAIHHGIGAPLVMCVDSADPAEVVLGHHRVELIEREIL